MKREDLINYCDKIILFALCAVVFFLPISKALIESFAGMAILFFLAKKIMQKDMPRTPLNLPILAYLFICFVSIFISSNPKISMRTFVGKDLENILVFLVTALSFNNENKIKKLLYVLFISSLILGIDGVFQYFTLKDFIRGRFSDIPDRVTASFVNPNAFGCYLIVVMPFIFAYLFANFNSRHRRFLFGLLSLLLLVCLILTVSRGPWFAFCISALFMSIWIPRLAVFLFIMALILIFMLPFFHAFIKRRIMNVFFFLDAGGADRMNIWRAGWRMFMSKPLIGVGLGTFMFNFKSFVGNTYTDISYAHNCYLQMAAEIGIIGLLAFLSILALFFYKGIKKLRHTKRNFSWYILLASISAILGYCVQMAIDTTFYSLDLGMLFWLVLGLGTALIINKDAEVI